jgi:uncharacterized membrane protein
MPNLLVITFKNIDEAGQVLEALEAEEHDHDISLDDTAVVRKDQDGTIHVDNEVDRGVKVGAIGGGLLGLVVGFLFGGPIASLALGAIAGALGGDLANLGIDQRFIDDVSAELEPGGSALFVMVREADPEATAAALAPFEGQIYYTNLPSDTEAELRRILSKAE